MKKIINFLTIVIATTSFVFAQATVGETAPVMTFDKTVHDYGTLKRGADGSYEFKFTNTGKEPLLLSKPKSSCACAVPEWPQHPIMPGQSATLKVTYNTQIVGPINRQVTVISNAINSPVMLKIRGAVIE